MCIFYKSKQMRFYIVWLSSVYVRLIIYLHVCLLYTFFIVHTEVPGFPKCMHVTQLAACSHTVIGSSSMHLAAYACHIQLLVAKICINIIIKFYYMYMFVITGIQVP